MTGHHWQGGRQGSTGLDGPGGDGGDPDVCAHQVMPGRISEGPHKVFGAAVYRPCAHAPSSQTLSWQQPVEARCIGELVAAVTSSQGSQSLSLCLLLT